MAVERAVDEETLDRLLVHFTAPDGHTTPLQRQVLGCLEELKARRHEMPCEHGIPRKFCTGLHK